MCIRVAKMQGRPGRHAHDSAPAEVVRRSKQHCGATIVKKGVLKNPTRPAILAIDVGLRHSRIVFPGNARGACLWKFRDAMCVEYFCFGKL